MTDTEYLALANHHANLVQQHDLQLYLNLAYWHHPMAQRALDDPRACSVYWEGWAISLNLIPEHAVEIDEDFGLREQH